MLSKNFILGIVLGVGIGIALAPTAIDAIPPTPAFKNIGSNDTDATTNPAWINATSYRNDLMIVTDGSILVEVIQYSGGVE